jgi:hypothetical protein
MISFPPNYQLRVNSTKSMIGNLQGASGAVEAPATIKVSSSTSSSMHMSVTNKLYIKKEFPCFIVDSELFHFLFCGWECVFTERT